MAQTFCGDIQFCNLFSNRSACPLVLVLKPTYNGCNIQYKTRPKLYFRTTFGTYVPIKIQNKFWFIDVNKQLQLHYKNGCVTLFKRGINNNINGFGLAGFVGDGEPANTQNYGGTAAYSRFSGASSYGGFNNYGSGQGSSSFFFNTNNNSNGCCDSCGTGISSESGGCCNNCGGNPEPTDNGILEESSSIDANTNPLRCIPSNILLATANDYNDSDIITIAPLQEDIFLNFLESSITPSGSPCAFISVLYSPDTYEFAISIAADVLLQNLPEIINYQILVRLTFEIISASSSTFLLTLNNNFNVTLTPYINGIAQTNISSNNYTVSDGIITIVRDYLTPAADVEDGTGAIRLKFEVYNSGGSTYNIGARTIEIYLITSVST